MLVYNFVVVRPSWTITNHKNHHIFLQTMKLPLLAAVALMSLAAMWPPRAVLAADPEQHEPDPHEVDETDDDVLPRDPNPPPNCSLYPIRPSYFQCRRSLLQCINGGNICHDYCHRNCRDVCFHDFYRCTTKARQTRDRALENQCDEREDRCHGTCMGTCQGACQPCIDMFATCRRCVTMYELSDSFDHA